MSFCFFIPNARKKWKIDKRKGKKRSEALKPEKRKEGRHRKLGAERMARRGAEFQEVNKQRKKQVTLNNNIVRGRNKRFHTFQLKSDGKTDICKDKPMDGRTNIGSYKVTYPLLKILKKEKKMEWF